MLGARDPIAAVALTAYADEAERRGFNLGFIEGLRRWVWMFNTYRECYGEGDPGMGIHRTDDSATIAEMKRGYSA